MAGNNDGRSNQGFAADPERAREAGRKGGKASHQSDKDGGSESSSGGQDDNQGRGGNM